MVHKVGLSVHRLVVDLYHLSVDEACLLHLLQSKEMGSRYEQNLLTTLRVYDIHKYTAMNCLARSAL